ncbi:hypothetical protein, partial [Streptomyces scabiei]|uniref:hypothetical protein n=1 Tax=Streptomyces scabiei TaxID=1930 RepID=UPI001F3B0DC7
MTARQRSGRDRFPRPSPSGPGDAPRHGPARIHGERDLAPVDGRQGMPLPVTGSGRPLPRP